MGKSAFAEAAKRSVETWSAGRAGAHLPAPAERLGPRNEGLPVSPFLERFLDRSVVERDIYRAIALAVPRSSRKSSSLNSNFGRAPLRTFAASPSRRAPRGESFPLRRFSAAQKIRSVEFD